MSKEDLVRVIGFVAIISAIVYVLKLMAERADTKLYSQKGYQDLQDDKTFNEIEKRRQEKYKQKIKAGSLAQ
jgi:hypothetical protein